MKLLSALAVILCTFVIFKMPQKLSIFSLSLQKTCEGMSPVSSENSTIQALVCGTSVAKKSEKDLLQATGLIHIFVVSGGHLIVLMEILEAFGVPEIFLGLAVVAFTMFTGFQAACVRSLLAFTVSIYLSRKRRPLKGEQKVFLAGILALFVVPDAVNSLGLQLSWAAALGLAVSARFLNPKMGTLKKSLITSVAVYFLVLPLLNGLHPLTILWNVTLGTMTAAVLFPLCGLAYVNFIFLKILEIIMPIFWNVLSLHGLYYEIPTQLQKNPMIGWCWIFILHTVLQTGLIFYGREMRT